MTTTLPTALSTLKRSEIKEALHGTGIKLDRAFFIGCARCGIEPIELAPRTKKSFRRPTDQGINDNILIIRQEGYETSRQKKLNRVLKEQEAVEIMLKNNVDPTLVPIEEPWLVGFGKKKSNVAGEHNAQELVLHMIEEQEQRERELKAAEKAAVAAALKRQGRDVGFMIAAEKASALRAQEAAEKNHAKEIERLEEEKIKERIKKAAAEKLANSVLRRQQEFEEDQKRLMATMQREREEAAQEKLRLVEAEKKRQRDQVIAAKKADKAAEERRRKTEAVFSEIDKKADENMRILEERAQVVARRQEQAAEEVAARNAAKQKASNARIAAVLEAQAQKQRDKRVDYETRLAATEEKRKEKKAEEEQEAARHAKKLLEDAKRREQAYNQAAEQRQRRIEGIQKHAEVKGKVFQDLQIARQEAHIQTMTRNEIQQIEICENVHRYQNVHEMKRQQGLRRIIEEDKRALMIKRSKEDLLKKRNIAAHQAVVRKQMIREKLGEMKSTQNFKGLKKLSSLVGIEDGDIVDTLALTGGAGAEPGSPTA